VAELEVLCVGSATLDTIAVVDYYPSEDSRVEAWQLVTAGGGPAATAAVTLARLGVPVGFCGVAADDAAGRRVRDELADEGVDVSWLRLDGERTGASAIVVSRASGARTILAGAVVSPDPAVIPLDAAHWMHVDQVGYGPVRAATARSGGGGRAPLLSVDGGNVIPELVLDGVALYAPTLSALRSRAAASGIDRGASDDDAVASAHREGADLVVATDGERGALFSGGGHRGSVPAHVSEIVSTLGAGDVFHGALLASLVQGDDLPAAVESASVVAALSCGALDGRSAIPRRAQLETEAATASGGDVHAR